MQIIKDKQLVSNTWTFVGDDEEINNNQDITVSLWRWTSHKQLLASHSGKMGVRFKPTDHPEDLVGNLKGLELIELEFLWFGDGRPFSQARLLRSRLAYQGEIRAVGHFLPDQIYFLARVGVNAFELENQNQIPLALSSMSDFTVKYQFSSD